MANKVQAKDVSAKQVLALIDAVNQLTDSDTCLTSDIYYLFDSFPQKVVKAKLKRLIDKDYIDGCACGCASYLIVLGKGYEVIYRKED